MDHADRMDHIYGAQRHLYDLTRKYYLFGRDRLIADLDAGSGETVLEVGCGTGRNLICAARRWPHARFFGLDISAAMLATARRNVASAGLTSRIVLAQGDAAEFDANNLFNVARFDRVVFSYTLSMIPPWRQALAQGLSVTADKGRLMIVDFGAQEGWPVLWRAPFLSWLRRFHVMPRVELSAVSTQLAEAQGRRAVAAMLWRGYAQRIAID